MTAFRSALFVCAMSAAGPRGTTAGQPLLPDLMPRFEDYTHMWWMEGFPPRVPGAPWVRCVQTGRYAMALDTAAMRVPHLGPLRSAVGYGTAASQSNGSVRALPPAELDLTIEVDGTAYRCTEGGRHSQHGGPRLIASGRFVQRADVTGLVFRAEDGAQLPVDARFETTAWPDRLCLLLKARPRLEPIAAGPTFGRVGGGYGFDGTDNLDEAYAPELDPLQFTLAFWVFPPADYRATRAYPWLICKGANEWADGHFGVILRDRAVPCAFLNIGGGRENTHTVSATRQGRHAFGLGTEKWHHLAMTYDGQELKLYVDGEPAGSQAVGKARRPQPGPLAFARRQDGSGDGYRFRGVLDEVRLCRRTLSADEIKAQTDNPEDLPPDDDLVREWTFDPAGEAMAGRPSATWGNAAMAVRLTTGGQTFEGTARARPDAPWAQKNAALVTVVVPYPPAKPRPRGPKERRTESSPAAVRGGVGMHVSPPSLPGASRHRRPRAGGTMTDSQMRDQDLFPFRRGWLPLRRPPAAERKKLAEGVSWLSVMAPPRQARRWPRTSGDRSTPGSH